MLRGGAGGGGVSGGGGVWRCVYLMTAKDHCLFDWLDGILSPQL